MKPLVAIVGRPNVGKSTLFNRLVGERRAIVLDTPGVTRDRHYGESRWAGRYFDVVDTGGFEPAATEGLVAAMREQALVAVEQADLVVFVLDGREGLQQADEEVAALLRRAHDRVIYAVNKIDGEKQLGFTADFYALGAEEVFPVSAEHGNGFGRLLDRIVSRLPPPDAEESDSDQDGSPRLALIGRPNVGKSTLANRLLGEERMIVSEVPGTTRDAVDLKLQYQGRDYLLIDTAGMRRQSKIQKGTSEGFSVVRSLRAVERCHVAVVLLDAVEGVTDQDARVVGVAAEKGRALVLAVNKWDAVEKDPKTADRFTEQLRMKLPFAHYAPVVFTSGLTGLRVPKLMELVDRVRASHTLRVSTGPLNRWLAECTRKHHPPVVGSRPLKFYYATQTRTAPPTIVLSCNIPDGVHFSYERFLMNQFRESFDVEGTPIRLVYKGKVDRHAEE